MKLVEYAVDSGNPRKARTIEGLRVVSATVEALELEQPRDEFGQMRQAVVLMYEDGDTPLEERETDGE